MEDFIKTMNSIGSDEDDQPKMRPKNVRIVCISDTHNHGPPSGFQLPKGDILIHAGDLTNRGTYSELEKAATWLGDADFGVKIIVAGNHELSLDPSYNANTSSVRATPAEEQQRCRDLIRNIPGVTYLEHASTTIHFPSPEEDEGGEPKTLNIFGSPCTAADIQTIDNETDGSTPRLNNNWAFQYPSSSAEEVWSAIPERTDIVITHIPAHGHCDKSKHWTRGGCPALLKRLQEVRPALHVCGHCHEGRGGQVVRWPGNENDPESVREWEDPGAGSKKLSLFDLTGSKGGKRLERGKETAVVNASIMKKSYERRGPKEMRKPLVVEFFI